MKLERLRNDNRKKIVIGVIATACIISASLFVGSRAKYRGTQSIPLVNGTINYTDSRGDLNIMAVYLVDKEQETAVDDIPTSGYTYNSTRSYCTTDGTNKDASITINYTNGKITVSDIAKKGTKCFFYFDRIPDTDKPTISSVVKTSTEKTSITVKVTASDVDTAGGAGTISKYYYSIDNGAYHESTNDTYTFSGLGVGSSHPIKVKVEDAAGNQSTEWSGTFETEKLTISKVEKTSTEKTSITVSVTASDTSTGGTPAKYYYSIDNGTYQESTNNTYTFSGLTVGTSYTVKVKVADSAGNESAEWSESLSTESDKKTPAQVIADLGLTATAGSTSFTGVSTTNEGLKSGTDDWGTTYYFRGNVANNWVKFAGFYWRIVRINGDGSIRLIYNGTSTTTIGTGTQIQASTYNPNQNDNAYVGYMYGSTSATTYAKTHKNTNSSTIKGVLDSWYKTNIVDKGHDSKVSKEAGFCNDRSVASSSQGWWGDDTKLGYGTNYTAYGPFSRIMTTSAGFNSTQTPKFSCTNASNDLFTTSSSTKGNKKLTYPVGLITTDEVIYAGGFGGKNNSIYYLYSNQTYWTMSPYFVDGGGTIAFFVSSEGTFGGSGVTSEWGVRPIINLVSNVTFTYKSASTKGTASDPYVVS